MTIEISLSLAENETSLPKRSNIFPISSALCFFVDSPKIEANILAVPALLIASKR